MDDISERKLLIAEIVILEQAVVDSGKTNINFPSDIEFFDSFSTSDLRAMKARFDRLVRTLGGLRTN